MLSMLTIALLSAADAEMKMFEFVTEEDLPVAGDIGIGFDATPVLDFGLNMVNIMNNTGQTAGGLASWQSGASQTLTAKYFLTDSTAVRIRVGINNASSTENSLYTNPVEDADPDEDSPSEISDTVSSSSSLVLLSGGYEMRRGYDRIQGFYGGEALLGISSTSSSTSYGWQYNDEAYDFNVISDGSSRALEETSGMALAVGVRGFVGVEYFIAPKISLGAEYGWAIGFNSQGQGSSASEVWEDPSGDGNGESSVEVVETGSSSNTRIGHDNGIDQFYTGGTGAVNITFHF